MLYKGVTLQLSFLSLDVCMSFCVYMTYAEDGFILLIFILSSLSNISIASSIFRIFPLLHFCTHTQLCI